MSILDLFEWEHGIDYGFDTVVGQQRHDFSCKRSGNRNLLLQRSRAKHRADDVKTFAEDLVQIDMSLPTGNSTDENDSPSQRHRLETRGEIRTTIQIEYDVKPAAAGHTFGKIRKPLQGAWVRNNVS